MGPAIEAARQAKNGELRIYPGCDHFNIYDGPSHEAVVADAVRASLRASRAVVGIGKHPTRWENERGRQLRRPQWPTAVSVATVTVFTSLLLNDETTSQWTQIALKGSGRLTSDDVPVPTVRPNWRRQAGQSSAESISMRSVYAILSDARDTGAQKGPTPKRRGHQLGGLVAAV